MQQIYFLQTNQLRLLYCTRSILPANYLTCQTVSSY